MTCLWRKNDIAIYGNAKWLSKWLSISWKWKQKKKNKITNIAFIRFRHFTRFWNLTKTFFKKKLCWSWPIKSHLDIETFGVIFSDFVKMFGKHEGLFSAETKGHWVIASFELSLWFQSGNLQTKIYYTKKLLVSRKL